MYNARISFVSGVASEPFLEGYLPKVQRYDKSKTQSPDPKLWVLPVSDVELELGTRKKELLCFDENEYLVHESAPHEISNLAIAGRFAKNRTIHHGGEPYIILLSYPNFMVDGRDYTLETSFGSISTIQPAKVNLDGVFRVTELVWNYSRHPTNGRVGAMRLEVELSPGLSEAVTRGAQ